MTHQLFKRRWPSLPYIPSYYYLPSTVVTSLNHPLVWYYLMRFKFHVASKKFGRSNNLASQSSEQGRLPSDEELPQWVSNDVNLSNLSMDTNVKHCKLYDSVFCAIEQLSLNNMMTVYGPFFQRLWSICQKKLNWKGQIMYKRMTPPWLLGNIMFLHGRNHQSSIPLRHSFLPRKSDFKELGQKIVGSAIIAAWICKKEAGTSSLCWFLRKKGVSINNYT